MVTERRPRVKEGSIHCSVRQMQHLIQQKDVDMIAVMINQLRDAWGQASDWERGEYLWLGKRYQEAYKKFTGKELKRA